MLAELGGKLRSCLEGVRNSGSDGSTDTAELNSILSEISRALIEADVNVKLVMKLRDNVKKRVEGNEALNNNNSNRRRSQQQQHGNNNTEKVIQRAVIDELVALLTPEKTKAYNMTKGRTNVILFVGLQGAGKTTSIAKFANHYQRKGWKTAMVCADTFRAGAFDQLKQNATKLRIPFYGSYTQADPVQVAEDGVSQFAKDGYEIVIVDTSGRHRQESALFEEMQEISAVIQPHNTVLVMDATQGQAVHEQALAFHHAVSVGSIIITKLDGHAKGGGALAAVAATQSPIIFLGNGEHFDDFDPFHAQSFVSKMMGNGDMQGLMEHMKQVHDTNNQKQLMENFSKGQFNLRDLYSQFQNILKLGPMNKVMGMMPGVPDYLIPKNNDADGTNRIKKFLYIMDSMTNKELDGHVDMHNQDDPSIPSRIYRIAKGSGVHPNEVRILLQTHKHFEAVASKVGKSGLMKGAAGNNQNKIAEQLKRNPNQLMQHIQKNMDPNMVKEMGGASNMMNMMQQMTKSGKGGGGGGMGGMPGGMDMNSMAQMMQQMGAGGGGPPAGGMPGGMDMNSMAQMMKQMGAGGGGMPGGGGPGGMDMNSMAQMMQQMGAGGGGGMRR